MKLETERLIIFPLSHYQLNLYLQTENKLEDALGLHQGNRTISPELMEALNETILPSVFSSSNYLYSTLWTIVHKERNQMVADFCFKGMPNTAGEIEIGYGTYEEFQGKGFMTEALGAMIEWAFSQPNVKTMLAETDQKNESSHKTLLKNNFKQYKVVDAMIWWKLDRPLSELEG